MQKRGLVIFLVLLVVYVPSAKSGSCDVSSWKLYDDNAAVISRSGVIGGYMFDFATQIVENGIKRTFYRTDFSSASSSNATLMQTEMLAQDFMNANYQNFGIYTYHNPKVLSESASNIDISFDYKIQVDPNSCEGLSLLDGSIVLHYDHLSNIIGIEMMLSLVSGTTSSSFVPPNSFSNPVYNAAGVGGTGAGGEGVGAPAKEFQKPQKTEPAAPQETENQIDKLNPLVSNLNPAKYVVPAIPIILLFLFLVVLSFMLGGRTKKKSSRK